MLSMHSPWQPLDLNSSSLDIKSEENGTLCKEVMEGGREGGREGRDGGRKRVSERKNLHGVPE